MTLPAITKILHLSDLHFGLGFGRTLWKDLLNKAVGEEPHIVVVTGDLVNNPFFWTLRNARKALEDLSTRVKERTGRPCPLVIVPGNHDTRLFGLFPVRWLEILAVFLVVASVVVWFYRGEWALTIAVAALLSIAFRCFLRKFSSVFSDHLATSPKPFADLRILLLPFDSARAGMRSARGHVSSKQFVETVRVAGPGEHHGFYRIALVHHHPLPIPYDHRAEHLLVLKNAGAFLHEMAMLNVRLVLHGHKHHTNYSRCRLKIGSGQDFELGVLASGTPTAKRDSGSGFMFHVLELHPGNNLQAVAYTAPAGGTFQRGTPFPIEADELWWQRQFEEARAKVGCEYGSVHSVRVINDDGDCYARRQFLDFHVTRPQMRIDRLPAPLGASASEDVGHIELLETFRVEGTALPGLELRIDKDPTKYTIKHQEGTVYFGKFLDVSSRVSFGIAYHALNSFALSEAQFLEMYGTGRAMMEEAKFSLRDIPAREVTLVIRLPERCVLDERPDLFADDLREQARLSQLCAGITVDPEAGLIICRIPYPLVNVEYHLRWRVPKVKQAVDDVHLQWRGAALDIATRILGVTSEAYLAEIEQRLATTMLEDALKRLALGADDKPDVSVMLYDPSLRSLRVIAATFPAGDPRRTQPLRFGDGIAGRAFKTRRARLFVKQKAIRDHTPLYYFPLDGRPVDPENVLEAVILALPLSHPKDPTATYGVLNLSSGRDSSGIVQYLKKWNEIEQFWLVANKSCFDVLEAVASRAL